jgi:HEAT repeat protein
VPALVEALSAESLEGIPGEAPKAMMRTLAALKDERGAAPIMPFLGNAFVWSDAQNALRAMGPVAEREVLKAYHHPNGDIRGKARELCRGYGTKDTAVVLQSVQDLKSDDVNRRNSAADWLARARPDDALRAQVNRELEDNLLRGDGQTREATLRVLDKWGTRDSVPALIKIVEDLDTSDPANRARHQAIDLLGKLKDERAAAALAERLTNGNDRVKAAQALKGIGPAAIPEVRKHIDDPDKGVQDEVKRLLKDLGSKENFDLTKAMAGLKSSDEVLRRESAKYFTTGSVDKERQAEVAKLLAECLEDTDAMARDQAARALVAWATPDTGPALLKAVDHPANAVRHPAMEALGKLKEERAAKPLAEHLSVVADRKVASTALVAIGANAEDEVAKQLGSKDKAVQLEACKVLQAIGTKASVPALEAAAQAATKAKLKDVTDAANAAAAEAGKR